MGKPDIIKIDDVEYIRKDYILSTATTNPEEEYRGYQKSMPYVIIRTYSAGVFAGYLEKRNGQEVVLRKARRIWYWDGAASLSQLWRWLWRWQWRWLIK